MGFNENIFNCKKITYKQVWAHTHTQREREGERDSREVYIEECLGKKTN